MTQSEPPAELVDYLRLTGDVQFVEEVRNFEGTFTESRGENAAFDGS